MPKPALRSVAPDETPETPATPQTLLEAVESGDILDIMLAQRRLIAESLTKAGDNTRPQYSNELNKLNRLIAEEKSRRHGEESDASVVKPLATEAWNGTGY